MELEKEIVAFWQVVGTDFSSFSHEGKSLFGAFEVMEMHSEKENVSAACLPHRSSHGISWAAHLLRWKRSQSQMKTAGSAVCTVVSAAQSQLRPSCCLCPLRIQTTLLSEAWVLVKVTLFSQYLYVLSLYQKFFPETQKHDFSLYGLTAEELGNGEFWVVELLEMMAGAFALEDLLKAITYVFSEGGWMSSWEASLAATGNEMKRMKSYFQTGMRKNASFVSLETYSSYALVEEAFVLVEFFFEEMVASLGLAVF